jgi:thiamine-phosphate pyrophosphorylase
MWPLPWGRFAAIPPPLPRAASSPLLCCVTGGRALGPVPSPAELLASFQGIVAAGVDWIQIREKDLPARELFDLTRQCVALAGARTRILVNDRLDVALAAGAAGVHLGRESATASEVKRWCLAGHAPQGFLVGVSCHSLDEALAAERDGADYIFFGPVFATPSKEAFGPPQGIARLAEVCRTVRIPALAIGGIAPENAAECLRAGAAGIAAIRLFQQPADLPTVIERLHRGL